MSIRDVKSGSIWQFGSHWNRKKLRSAGTGIHWNEDRQMWEVRIVHHGGYYKTAQEASMALTRYLSSTESVINKGATMHDEMDKALIAEVNEARKAIESTIDDPKDVIEGEIE